MSMEMAIKPILTMFDEIRPGDMFLNNCPFTGATHHADMIIAAPIFFEGQPLFWTVALSHHADVGAPIPSTYLPYAKTIYEEGVHFPCVRIVENGIEREDILRIGMYQIRAPDMWLGDLRAQMGSCRTGERRLHELLHRYGKQAVLDFVEEWFEYGTRRMVAEIRKLPAGTYTYETRHDPVPGVADEGMPR